MQNKDKNLNDDRIEFLIEELEGDKKLTRESRVEIAEYLQIAKTLAE